MANRYKILKCDFACRQILSKEYFVCQKCKECKPLDVSHCFGKKAYPHLRHDLNNLLLLCNDCHIGWWHKYPKEAWSWFEENFEERYNYLIVAKNKIVKLNKMYYEQKYQELKKMEGE